MRNNNEKIIQSWNDNSRQWINAIQTQALESRRLVTNDAILEAVLACEGTRILDVGCGQGWLSHELAKNERNVIGFDVNADLVETARKDSFIKFHVLSYEKFITNPELVGKDFDVVVCNFSLLGDPLNEMLIAMRKITNPFGHLVIQTLHPYSSTEDMRYEDGWREETFTGLPGHWSPMPWYFRTVSSWISGLISSGWHVNKVTEPLHPVTGKPASLIMDSLK